MLRILLLVLGVSSVATAAPVPKSSLIDGILARVTVEHVGSALSQPGLRNELALTDEQEKKLAALGAVFEKSLKQIAGPRVVEGPTNPADEIEKFTDLANEVAQFDASAVQLLTATQLRRLRQVQLQKGGPAALFNRFVLRALSLTAEQEDAMSRQLAKYKRIPMVNEEMVAMLSLSTVEADQDTPEAIAQAGFNGPQSDKAAIEKVIRKEIEAQERVRTAMLKCLTAEQRATWDTLIGPPLKGEELLRASSMFGDPKVVVVMVRTEVNKGAVAPPAQFPPPQLQPPPPGQLVPPPAQLPPPAPLPPPGSGR